MNIRRDIRLFWDGPNWCCQVYNGNHIVLARELGCIKASPCGVLLLVLKLKIDYRFGWHFIYNLLFNIVCDNGVYLELHWLNGSKFSSHTYSHTNL
jgi:hypothetical protein